MPFVTQDRRDTIDKEGLLGLTRQGLEIQLGDRCYAFYAFMVKKWKDSPCWTTAHYIYKDVVTASYGLPGWDSLDDVVAYQLAWQVFFQLHVIPYELKKREENGDI